MNRLNEEDSILFYKLFFLIIDYVNYKKDVDPSLIFRPDQTADVNKIIKVADVLWENPVMIDRFLRTEGKDLTSREKKILKSWKKRIRGSFILERHLKNGSIFLSEDNKVYEVKGIVSTWDEMFSYRKPPIWLEGTLIPFEDCIISDGLVFERPIYFRGGAKQMMKNNYMNAKKNGEIITAL
jgi:hypothetical protein